jgi:hypothetical protein
MGSKKWGRKKRSAGDAADPGSPLSRATSPISVRFNSSGDAECRLSKKDSKASLSSHRRSMSVAASSEQLVELMGARLCCLVEENTYFRDKVLHYGSLGLLGKRGYSDARNGNGETRGTIWRPRVLVVTTTSVAMFGVKSGSSASNSGAEAMATGALVCSLFLLLLGAIVSYLLCGLSVLCLQGTYWLLYGLWGGVEQSWCARVLFVLPPCRSPVCVSIDRVTRGL